MSLTDAIVAELLRQPALLSLRTRRLAADVRARYGSSWNVTWTAIGRARAQRAGVR